VFTIGRLTLTDPEGWTEPLGDPIGSLGGAAVPAPRDPLKPSTALDTFAADGSSDLLADRMRLRRQLRALLNNTPLKLGGLYVAWDQDAEQNGWYVPDRANLTDATGGNAALAVGYFKLDGLALSKAGAPRTNRRATQAYARDRRLSTVPRDFLRTVLSTDFASLASLVITNLPATVSDGLNAVSGGPVKLLPLPRSSWEGATEFMAQGLVDLTTVSYEQTEADRNKGDVVIFDRRGTITAPATGVDAAWEEVYGPDYQWSTSITTAADVPVIENGRCRVRYDATNTPGFRVDVWTGAAWAEQGKVVFQRIGDSVTTLDTLVSSTLVEWTPERAVILVRDARSGDSISRERSTSPCSAAGTGPGSSTTPRRRPPEPRRRRDPRT
jgi:hypothetical protein